MVTRGGARRFGFLHPDFGFDEAQEVGALGADQLEPLLERAVVAEEQFGDARGVARAAQILEQHGIEAIGELGVGQPGGEAHIGTDPRGADAVPRGLSFGEVERIGKGAQYLREPRFADGRLRPRRPCGPAGTSIIPLLIRRA